MIDSGSGSPSDDEADDASVRRFDRGDRSPSVVVAEAMEAMLDDANWTLFDYVDPDALDDLVGDAAHSSSVRLSFEVEGTVVTVHGDGRVVLHPD